MFLGSFGVKATFVYVLSGTLLSMAAGYLLGKMRLESYLCEWVRNAQKQSNAQSEQWDTGNVSFAGRLPVIVGDSWGLVKKVFPYVVIGIGIGACMYGFVPEGFFESVLSSHKWWGVPMAVMLAVPMYANPASIVPIVEVFVAKGIPLGTAIAFMMSVIGLSMPEATMLKQVMTWRLIGIFFGVVTLLIILSGYLFNCLL